MHGWIRWHDADKKAVLIDSHGQSVWIGDLADVNLKVLDWILEFYSELGALVRAGMLVYGKHVDWMLKHPGLPPDLRVTYQALKRKTAAVGSGNQGHTRIV